MTSQTIEPDRADDIEIEYVSHTQQGYGLPARLGAEVFGTFLLVFVGVGIIVYGSLGGSADQLAIALGFGLAYLAGIAAVGHVSGGHFNPAVSLGAAITGRISWGDLLPYWVAQVLGGTAAAAALFFTIPSTLPVALGIESTRTFFTTTANGFGEHSAIATLSGGAVTFTLVGVMVVEVVATALLVGVVLAVTNPRGRSRMAPVAIGLALAGLVLVAAPISGGSLNPARSSATVLFSEPWPLTQLWLFWVAPLLGGALAGLLSTLVAPSPVADEDEYEYDEDEEPEDDDLVVEDDEVVRTSSPSLATRTDIGTGDETDVETVVDEPERR